MYTIFAKVALFLLLRKLTYRRIQSKDEEKNKFLLIHIVKAVIARLKEKLFVSFFTQLKYLIKEY